MEDIQALIFDYLNKASACVVALKAHANGTHPIRAWRDRKIEATGEVLTPDVTQYSMHGIGCLFETMHWSVDVDLNAQGECGGFDAWRLWQFAKSLSLGEQVPLALIESRISDLQMSGVVRPSTEPPCLHLFQLAVPIPVAPSTPHG
jgi:hypothetical protein